MYIDHFELLVVAFSSSMASPIKADDISGWMTFGSLSLFMASAF